MFSTSIIVPIMGHWYDSFKAGAIATGATEATADAIAGSNTFLKVAGMPAILLVIFIIIYFIRRKYFQQHSNVHNKAAGGAAEAIA